ncbi:hypothetical protein R3I93_010685 [Phoxinus phoxinus]|uniref:Uncharacterized protein n=1 Tax=Phoxinus phoxinus TaxID=58324 RepID=A0AAN9CWQ2_9TELE
MPPKKNPILPDEVEEIKKSLDFLSAEISTIAAQQKKIIDLMGEIQTLKRQSLEKDRKIAILETRVADLEQYSRINDVVISGLRTKHRNYARVAADAGHTVAGMNEASEEEKESLEQQVICFLDSKGIAVDSRDIEACHTLPSKNKTYTPLVIIRFTNRKKKSSLLGQGRKLKGTEVYINEHLTKKNADIARKARILRKQNKIQATWVRNCKIFIKLHGSTPEAAKVILIRDITELDKFEEGMNRELHRPT